MLPNDWFERAIAIIGYGVRTLSTCFFIVRGPMLASILGFAIVAVPNQIIDIYRVLAENETQPSRTVLFSLSGLVFATFCLWIAAERLARRPRKRSEDLKAALLAWLPGILAALPSFGVALGIFTAIPEGVKQQTDAFMELCIGAAIIFGLVVIIAARLSLINEENEFSLLPDEEVPTTDKKTILLHGAPFVIIFAAIWTWPINLPQYVGVLFITFMFISAFGLILSLFTRIYDRHSIPILSSLLIFAMVVSFFGLNHNHLVFHKPADPPRPEEPTMKAAFIEWLDKRADRERYTQAGRPYPVYIIAAEGGGIYAAYQAAGFLARAQSFCPAFAQHVFAISSVSGGSVGAATFAGIMRDHAQNAPDSECTLRPIQSQDSGMTMEMEEVDAVLGQDLLSPLVAAFTFPDFVQRFLPFPIYAWDRARYLQGAFEAAWVVNMNVPDSVSPTQAAYGNIGPQNDCDDPSVTANFMASPYHCHWSADKAVPALFMNATRVSNGARIAFAPFRFRTVEGVPMKRMQDHLGPDHWFPIASAAVTSARFPYLTPVGRLPDNHKYPDGLRTFFADGGYAENSGNATAHDIIHHLSRHAEAGGLNVVFKVISFDGFEGLPPNPEIHDPISFVEVASPVRALLNGREERANQARLALEALQCGIVPCNHKDTHIDEPNYRQVFMNFETYSFPLGWRLSQASRFALRSQLGHPLLCDPDKPQSVREVIGIGLDERHADEDRKEAIRKALLNNNDCALMDIVAVLSPDGLPSRSRYW